MPTSELALRLFLILLPGFSAAYLVQALTVRAKQSDLEKVIEAFVFSSANKKDSLDKFSRPAVELFPTS